MLLTWKALGRLAFLNHNIHTAADPTPVDVEHAAHSGWPTMSTNHDDPPALVLLSANYNMLSVSFSLRCELLSIAPIDINPQTVMIVVLVSFMIQLNH